jgi:hypothetical protein
LHKKGRKLRRAGRSLSVQITKRMRVVFYALAMLDLVLATLYYGWGLAAAR